MLTLTDQARDIVRKIPAQAYMSYEAGLRIAHRQVNGSRGPLQVTAADGPKTGDQVVEYDGARVFLGKKAAQFLQGKQLDVSSDPQGRIQFVVTAQR